MSGEQLTIPAPPLVDRTAQAEPPRRYRIRIVVGLVVGFGGLVILAVIAVLALGAWTARTNTVNLLRDKAQAAIGHVSGNIQLYLRPAESQINHLMTQIEAGRIPVDDDEELGKYLTGALAATPEVRSLLFIHPYESMLRALRGPNDVELYEFDISKMPAYLGMLSDAKKHDGVFWGDVVRVETSNIPLVNVQAPIRRNGEYLGLLVATVQIDRLSELLDELAAPLHGVAFIMYDRQYVLAHPLLIGGMGRRSRGVLPTVAEVGDPVVAAFVGDDSDESSRLSQLAADAGIRLVEVNGSSYALLSATLAHYSTRPWVIGVYFPAADFTDELGRMRWAAAAGLAVLLASLLVAYAFARYLTAPVIRLADTARRAKDLSLDGLKHLPDSIFHELSEASNAFNAMIAGLRWFESYVPKKLVRRLVKASESGGDVVNQLESKERMVTVMFTDIVGFTGMAETLPAPEVAAMLNAHFAVLAEHIEAEGGTIDKFIGDCVMAFWGAPDKQKDHARRAWRAATAIAAETHAANEAARAAGRRVARIRIGLHSGPVVVGNIGAPGRINYTIIGDTVNIASRLEQMGKTYDDARSDVVLVISAETRRAARLSDEVAPAGTVNIRGRATQTEIFCARF